MYYGTDSALTFQEHIRPILLTRLRLVTLWVTVLLTNVWTHFDQRVLEQALAILNILVYLFVGCMNERVNSLLDPDADVETKPEPTLSHFLIFLLCCYGACFISTHWDSCLPSRRITLVVLETVLNLWSLGATDNMQHWQHLVRILQVLYPEH